MPTSAATGTKSAKKDERTDSEREADENAAAARRQIRASQAAPLADHSGNGTVQSVKADGSIVNYDAAEDGWDAAAHKGTSKHVSRKARKGD